ncbi:MAG: thioredoxin [Thermoplasmata archaeon]
MGSKPTDVSDTELEKLVQSGSGIVVDFWAPWCQPCKFVSPVVEKMAGRYGDDVEFVKVNIDDNPDSATKYQIMGVPTLLFFKNGDVAERIVGVVPEDRIESSVQGLLA